MSLRPPQVALFSPANPHHLTSLTQYQFSGLRRLAAFRDQFRYDATRARKPFDRSIQNISEQFTNVFCEYQLADTNYAGHLLQSRNHTSEQEWVAQLDVEGIIRFLTYIIWTDKARTGYLKTRYEDNTIFLLLNRLEEL